MTGYGMRPVENFLAHIPETWYIYVTSKINVSLSHEFFLFLRKYS